MQSRQAACDPCRKAKLACGHEHPVCARCRQRNKASACAYRASPFKRKQTRRSLIASPDTSSPDRNEATTQSPTVQYNHYPNPGYLGPSSHVAIFDHILSDQGTVGETYSPPSTTPLPDHPSLEQGAKLTKQLFNSYNLKALEDLVTFWRLRGVSLAVAEPFVKQCAESSNYSPLLTYQQDDWHTTFAKRLLLNTCRQLSFDQSSTMSSYTAQFLGPYTRWETFGIFLSAVIRATMDVRFFPSLYTTPLQNRELRTLLMKLIDCSLEICLSVDRLNDLQLVLQYENFIIHSHVDGDHSYRYWTSLGDVVTSLSALGYHEDIDAKPNTPRFLTEIRKSAFARTYSADKNVSIFLGRPLRMSKRFWCFRIPQGPSEEEVPQSTEDQVRIHEWNESASMCYRADTRWHALCAFIKEEILELLFDRNRPNCQEKVQALEATAQMFWNALPAHFRYDGCLKQSGNTPFERDFLISVRLNYLHILFLLRRLLLRRISEPDASVLEVAQQILHLVVEAMLLREELVNSGTALDWKITCYGLPAAGILLLALLKQQTDPSCPRLPRAQVVEDLFLLAAEVERGTIVRPDEPNYDLLSKATRTIRSFLAHINSNERVAITTEEDTLHEDVQWLTDFEWDFDVGFWQGLVDQTVL